MLIVSLHNFYEIENAFVCLFVWLFFFFWKDSSILRLLIPKNKVSRNVDYLKGHFSARAQ